MACRELQIQGSFGKTRFLHQSVHGQGLKSSVPNDTFGLLQNKFALGNFFFGRLRARRFGHEYCSTRYFRG